MAKRKDVKAIDLKKDRSSSLVLSDGKEYKLVLNLNAMARLEEYYDTTDDAFKAVDSGKITAFRCILWAMMHKYHNELTIEKVGELIDVHELQNIANTLQGAIGDSLPEVEESEQDLPN